MARDKQPWKGDRRAERSAIWTFEETKLLLTLWGRDWIKCQSTNGKRTKRAYDMISEQFKQAGYERSPEQVRTRVFNMIAEYRRILRDVQAGISVERKNKCVYFAPIHKIYQAKTYEEVDAAVSLCGNDLDGDLSEADIDISSHDTSGEINIDYSSSDESAPTDMNGQERIAHENHMGKDKMKDIIRTVWTENGKARASTAGDKVKPESTSVLEPGFNSNIDLNDSDVSTHVSDIASIDLDKKKKRPETEISNQTALKRARVDISPNNLPPTPKKLSSAKTPRQKTPARAGTQSKTSRGKTGPRAKAGPSRLLSQAKSEHDNGQDVSSTTKFLLDRLFDHLRYESQNLRDWMSLEKERLAQEMTLRQEEKEREARREQLMLENFNSMHEKLTTVVSELTKVCNVLVNNKSETS